MKRILSTFIFIIFVSPLFAVDYSEMSTQELIAIMGYVETKNLKKFNIELTLRLPTMNETEHAKYEKNLKNLKKK
jgi:hypothetical protein